MALLGNLNFTSIIWITYRTQAIILIRNRFDYRPQILEPKIEEFLCLLHKLSVTLITLQSTIQSAVKNGVKNMQTAGYGKRTVLQN